MVDNEIARTVKLADIQAAVIDSGQSVGLSGSEFFSYISSKKNIEQQTPKAELLKPQLSK